MLKKNSEYEFLVDEKFYLQLDKMFDEVSAESNIICETEKGLASEYFKEGNPFIEVCSPLINSDDLYLVFMKVKKLFLKFNFNEPEIFDELEKHIKTEEKSSLLNLAEILELADSDKDIDDIFSDPYMAFTILVYTLKPFLKNYSKYLINQFNISYWEKGYCPVCGHDAGLALNYKKHEGKRYLWCPVCETEWVFKRISCPSCYEENPDNLGYFRIEDRDDGYRVNVCYTCNRYIKVYDEHGRQENKLNKFLEEKKTVELDYLAQNEGFKPTS